MESIVQFISYDNENDVGGVSSWLRKTVLYLRQQGIDARVDLFYFGDGPGSNAEWYRKNNVPFRVSPWIDDTEKVVRQCLIWLRESMPQVYIPNCMLPAYFAAAEAKRCGAHTIGVLHSDDPFYWGVVDEFILGDKKWCLDEVVVVSRFLHDALESNASVRIPFHEISCGVAVCHECLIWGDQPFRIIYTGRLVEKQKRISDLTRAFCRVAREHSTLEAWIVGAGSGESSVRAIIQEEGLEKKVILKGRVESERIYDVLRKCHVFVLLSDYEGTPISLMEAMSVGMVPICLKMRSGVGEIISQMKNGILVCDRERSFSEAVSFLIENPEIWANLSATAQRTISERYSDEECMGKWKALLLAHRIMDSRHYRPNLRLRLPPRNPKFGGYDQRHLSQMQQTWNRLRRLAGSIQGSIIKLGRSAPRH